MKKYILFTVCILFANCLYSQGVWTWKNGSNLKAQGAVFGTMGVPDPANTPCGTYAAAPWQDLQGNFWIYDGYADAGTTSVMWKFDPINNEWTWMSGSNTNNTLATYGSPGVFDPSYTPGFRSFGSLSWTDPKGNFWLYGGESFGSVKADLWKYDPSINQWAFMNGNQNSNVSPIYGTKLVPAATNTPGSLREVSASWVDDSGNLYLYGGESSSSIDLRDDVWKYDVTLNEWIWLSGSGTFQALANYGAIGVASAANSPGGRVPYCHFKDNQGNFWIFGGTDLGSPNSYGDLWKFDPSNNWWTWVSGSSVVNFTNQPSNFCQYNASDFPSSRFECRANVVDCSGNFWFFGGIANSGGGGIVSMNDLWMYNPSGNQWKLVSGTTNFNDVGSYGTINVSSASNVPCARMGALMWLDKNNKLWLFGGSTGWTITGNSLNDMWEYDADSTCAAFGKCNFLASPQAQFNTATTLICQYSCISFINQSKNAKKYKWYFPGAVLSTDTAMNPTNICYNTAGNYDVELIASNGNSTDSILLKNYITVVALPSTGVITLSRDNICLGSGLTSVIRCSDSSGYLQWQSSTDNNNFLDIASAHNASYTTPASLSQTTVYRVIASDTCGGDTSGIITVHIVPEPVARFIFTVSSQLVTFNSDSSSHDVTSYSWDFGDGNSSAIANPVHSFTGADSFYVCLTVYNNSNCSYTLCKEVNLITGVENISESNFFHLYPNPANNTINLAAEGLMGNYQLKIYNVLGQQVWQLPIALTPRKNIAVDLSGYAPGVYQLVLTNDKGYLKTKFVHLK